MARQAFAKKVEENSEYVEYLYDETYVGDYEGLRGRVRITKNPLGICVVKSIDNDGNKCEMSGALIASKIIDIYRKDKVFPERASRQS